MSLTGGSERQPEKGEPRGTLEDLLPHPLSCSQPHRVPFQPALGKHCSLHFMLALCKGAVFSCAYEGLQAPLGPSDSL